MKKYYETRKNRPVLSDLDPPNDDESDIEDFRVPDRVLNPGKYKECHVPYSATEDQISPTLLAVRRRGK